MADAIQAPAAAEAQTVSPPPPPPPAVAPLVAAYEHEPDAEEAVSPPPPPPPPAVVSPPPPPPPAKHTHPRDLERMAIAYGLTDQEIEATPTPALQAKVVRLGEERKTAAQKPASPPPPAVPEEEPVDLGIDESKYDPEVIGVLKRIKRENKKEVKELRDKLEAREKQDVEGRRNAVHRRFEELCDAQPEKYGVTGKFEVGSAEFLRRQAVYNGLMALGQGATTLDADHAKIDAALFGARSQSPPPPASPPPPPAAGSNGHNRITPEQWNKGTVVKPTKVKGPEKPKGPERATEYVANFLRENNADNDPFAAGEEEEGQLD